jgi:predicted secreted protein
MRTLNFLRFALLAACLASFTTQAQATDLSQIKQARDMSQIKMAPNPDDKSSANPEANKGDAPYTQDKPVITVTSQKPEFTIKLKTNPTTGYSWFLREYNTELLTPVRHSFEFAADKKLMGAPGYELWTFRAKPAAFVVPQQSAIRFVYARPWEVEDNNQVTFKVTTEGVGR